jgi:hypothetical protein
MSNDKNLKDNKYNKKKKGRQPMLTFQTCDSNY